MSPKNEIDPIEYGKLLSKVESLEEKVGSMELDLKELLELANRSRGAFWVGLSLASFMGALATILFNRFLVQCMAIYRGDGGAGDATTDITINSVTQKATEAATSATNAANSATSASTSASNAATSATNAANSATSAGTSATSASTSATNASVSEGVASAAATAAQTAQTAAELAETNAETAETNAAGSATAAASSATSAASSAATATTKASEAAASASAAASSASAASTSASNASTSETNAATSETNAGNSATAAASSASSASTSASTATTKASEASTSATNAATSETNAATSATNAATSETNAASSASSASTSASTATTQASNAATSATNAATSATNAATSASAASTSETNAANSASAASTSETNAASSATAAAASAVTAASFTPSQTGNAGKYLTTDGSVTSWGTVAGGDVVDDTTPQLGGDLDLNSNDITGTGNVNITGTVTSDSLTVDTNTLHVDATNNRVGIGTTSPAEELHISNSTDVRIALENTANRRYDIVSGDSGEFKIWDTAVGERMSIDSSGNLKFNSGYGSSTTAYGCRAWVNFNGTGTVGIRASGNVSSITDNGVGDYTINFSTAMPDTNYVGVGQGSAVGTDGRFQIEAFSARTTSAYRVASLSAGQALSDGSYVSMSFFR